MTDLYQRLAAALLNKVYEDAHPDEPALTPNEVAVGYAWIKCGFRAKSNPDGTHTWRYFAERVDPNGLVVDVTPRDQA